jgi:uncharacterized membrane protein YdjX (TVP38/TMEM64 family)
MPESKPNRIPRNLIILAVVGVAIFAAWFLLPLKQWLQGFTDWIEGLGVWGGVLFAAVYVIATVVLAPGSLFTIAAGLVFGLGWGLSIVLVGATIGASLAFLIARYCVRDRIEGMIERRAKLKAVDRAVAEEGWKIVALLRLSPLVPFNIQNYFFGLTKIDFWHYVVATFVGIIHGTLVYLYIGAIGGALVRGEGQWGTPQWALFGVGLAATIVVAVLIARKARQKLKEAGVADESEHRAERSRKFAQS